MSAINADKIVFLDTVCVIESVCVSTGGIELFWYLRQNTGTGNPTPNNDPKFTPNHQSVDQNILTLTDL